jgi:hypothetical protein
LASAERLVPLLLVSAWSCPGTELVNYAHRTRTEHAPEKLRFESSRFRNRQPARTLVWHFAAGPRRIVMGMVGGSAGLTTRIAPIFLE